MLMGLIEHCCRASCQTALFIKSNPGLFSLAGSNNGKRGCRIGSLKPLQFMKPVGTFLNSDQDH